MRNRGKRRHRLSDFLIGAASIPKSSRAAQQNPQPSTSVFDKSSTGVQGVSVVADDTAPTSLTDLPAATGVQGVSVVAGDAAPTSLTDLPAATEVQGITVVAGDVVASGDVEVGTGNVTTGVGSIDPSYDAADRNWVRYRPRWGSLPRLLLFGFILVVAIVWIRERIYVWVDDQINPEGQIGGIVEYTLPPGASVNDVATDLATAGVIRNATVFRYWLRCDGELSIVGFLSCDLNTPVTAGNYEFRANMDFPSVVEVLSEGPIPSGAEVLATVTIPEGLRWSEIAALLVKENPSFAITELESAFVSLLRESDYLPDDTSVPTLEGLLFPATYDILGVRITDESHFLNRLIDEFNRRFKNLLVETDGFSSELQDLGLDAYDIIIVASLIEEEALIAEDRPKIARVIYNRLAVDEYLGIDASVCYAVNKPSCADLTEADLRVESPWNTRTVRGLPPTPISAPGEASLRAALQPAEGDWLFYVLTDAGGVPGAHHFSTTIEEHIKQVGVCRELGYCG